MSTRLTLQVALREQLDDADESGTNDTPANPRWSNKRLQRILERKRRDVFQFMKSLAPGRWFRTKETLTVVSGTREYALNVADEEILKVERIAVNGVALAQAVPIRHINWRDVYDNEGNYIWKGTDAVCYVVAEGQSGNAAPLLTIGFVPTPETTAADFMIHVNRGPSTDWTADAGATVAGVNGTGPNDAKESGLPVQWEDLLLAEAVVEAIRQRPPKEGVSLGSWEKQLTEKRRRMTETVAAYEQDSPREVRPDEEDC